MIPGRLQLLIILLWGGSPGLVVMGGDSCSKGREFESQHRILDGHFFTFICCKICNVFWKDKNKWKRGLGWPIFLDSVVKSNCNHFFVFTIPLHFAFIFSPHYRYKEIYLYHGPTSCDPSSVFRLGQISALWWNLKIIWQSFDGLFCCKWPIIKQIIKPSGQTDTKPLNLPSLLLQFAPFCVLMGQAQKLSFKVTKMAVNCNKTFSNHVAF